MASFGLFYSNWNKTTLVSAQALAGIGVAATGGTSNALVVNEIKSKSPDGLARAFGRISYLVAIANLVGGAIGIAIFSEHPRMIWLAAIGFFILAALVMMTFRDARPATEKTPWRAYARGVVVAARSRSALTLIITNASAIAPYFLYQLKFESFSLSFVFVGFLLMNAATFVGPLLMNRLKISVRFIWAVALANLVAVVLFAFTHDVVSASITFVMHVMLQVVQVALSSGLYHADVEDTARATSSSVISMLDSLIVAVLAPVIGFLTQSYGIGWGIVLSCCLYAIVAVVTTRKISTREDTVAAEQGEVHA